MRFLRINEIFLPLLLLVFVLSPTLLFVVDETQQAIITELGEYKRTVSKPGLSFKKPLLRKLQSLIIEFFQLMPLLENI